MSASASLRRSAPLPAALQIGLVASLLAVAAGCWVLTGDRMAGMDAGPGTALGGLGWFLVSWAVMMAAMMLPAIGADGRSPTRGSSKPGANAGGSRRSASAPRSSPATCVAWSGGRPGSPTRPDRGRALAAPRLPGLGRGRALRRRRGAILAARAVSAHRAVKDACLCHCRSRRCSSSASIPLAAAQRARARRASASACCWCADGGALRAGRDEHRVDGPRGRADRRRAAAAVQAHGQAGRAVAVVLAVLGLAVALAPGDVPGLTLPDSQDAAGMTMTMQQ